MTKWKHIHMEDFDVCCQKALQKKEAFPRTDYYQYLKRKEMVSFYLTFISLMTSGLNIFS